MISFSIYMLNYFFGQIFEKSFITCVEIIIKFRNLQVFDCCWV